MLMYDDYVNSLIINKAVIPESEFSAYAAEAERLILSAVTQPIPDKYADCVKATSCLLCHRLYIDNTAVIATDGNGARLKSQSETSKEYSYSFSYADAPTDSAKEVAYRKIIVDGLTKCNGEWTGLFYMGLNKCRGGRR